MSISISSCLLSSTLSSVSIQPPPPQEQIWNSVSIPKNSLKKITTRHSFCSFDTAKDVLCCIFLWLAKIAFSRSTTVCWVERRSRGRQEILGFIPSCRIVKRYVMSVPIPDAYYPLNFACTGVLFLESLWDMTCCLQLFNRKDSFYLLW